MRLQLLFGLMSACLLANQAIVLSAPVLASDRTSPSQVLFKPSGGGKPPTTRGAGSRNDRLLFLSGDKGYSQLQDLQNRSKPHMVFHGSCFSLMVNYHAIGQYVMNQGGQALHTLYHHASLNISAFLLGQPATSNSNFKNLGGVNRNHGV